MKRKEVQVLSASEIRQVSDCCVGVICIGVVIAVARL